MQKHLILTAIFFALLASCKPSIKPAYLYGKWNYIQVEHPDADPPDSLRHEEIVYNAPYIRFSKNNEVLMVWGGKVLSQGKFSTDGQKIRIEEYLPGGKTREFTFWVIKLTRKEIVFETTVEGKSRVTAVRD